jgi:hypothetical protein
MEYGAIDLHKNEGQVRIVTERGEVIDRRIATTRERLTAVVRPFSDSRMTFEAASQFKRE